ncbi:MAG: sigma-70 family RNA polymerase sigma factor [Bdellovibrionales bacterium]|nr:sigma-70 family RNA polymerase sigma factor [Bdellovibrionales bacterium]
MRKLTSNREVFDPAAENWLSEHGDYLYRYAMLRTRDSHISEDLVQETLLAAINGWASFQGRSSIRTWLTGILRNKIIDHYRSTRQLDKVSVEIGELRKAEEQYFNSIGLWSTLLGDWARDPDLHLQNKQFFEKLRECLSKLSGNSRRAFILKVVDGVESEQICNVLGVSSSNLWVLLHRARIALRDCIEANWIKNK